MEVEEKTRLFTRLEDNNTKDTLDKKVETVKNISAGEIEEFTSFQRRKKKL